MSEPRWLEVDLSRLDANLAWWRDVVGTGEARSSKSKAQGRRVRVCGVVKADAYGLGAVPIAQRLAQRGIDMLAVYSPAQADELLGAGIACPVLVLNPMRELPQTAALCAAATAGQLHLTVNDPEQLEMIERVGRAVGCALPVHLHVDTGMSRSGLNPDDFHCTLAHMAKLAYVRLAGISTHLATAGEDPAFACEQLARLDRVLDGHRAQVPPGVVIHAGATFAVCRDARFHRDMVRIGLGLYGHGPDMLEDGQVIARPDCPLPIVRWLARIVHVQHYAQGATVGYDCTFRLKRDSVLAVVPSGYADGYPLALSNRALVRLLDVPGDSRAFAPVLGKVSMDQIVIDLTDHPQPGLDSTVELIGNDPVAPNSLRNLATLAGSTCYEMLTRLSPRLPRKYLGTEAGALAHPVPLGATV